MENLPAYTTDRTAKLGKDDVFLVTVGLKLLIS
jgi:hypothetical protein